MITFELCHEVYKRMDNITQSDCVFRIILGNSVMSVGCDVLYFVDVNVYFNSYSTVSADKLRFP